MAGVVALAAAGVEQPEACLPGAGFGAQFDTVFGEFLAQWLVVAVVEKRPSALQHQAAIAGVLAAAPVAEQQIDVAFARLVEAVAVGAAPAFADCFQSFSANRATPVHGRG